MFWSARYGLISLAELLFGKGAKVMDTTPAGCSALHIACAAPNGLDVLRFFLNYGGDLNFENADIIPAFHEWLFRGADAECVEEMLRNGASCSLINHYRKRNALHYFGSYGTDKKVLDLLLDIPLDIEKRSKTGVRDDMGETAFHKLVSRPDIPMDILKAFLERGADVNAEDDDLERPLYKAANRGENDAVELIISRVSDVDDENKSGQTALHAAAFAGQETTVEILVPDSPTNGHSEQPIVAVGFCTSSAADLVEFPGCPPKTTAPSIQTWAYHGGEGLFGASDQKKWPDAFGQHYGPGDTVGCGLDMDAKEIFFTRNGVRIGRCSDAGPVSFVQFVPFPTIRSSISSLNPTYYLFDLRG